MVFFDPDIMADDGSQIGALHSPQHTRNGASFGAGGQRENQSAAPPGDESPPAHGDADVPPRQGVEAAAAAAGLQGQAAAAAKPALPARLKDVIDALQHAPQEAREAALVALLGAE